MLIDENDFCEKPFETCLTFGMAAQFIIYRGKKILLFSS
jgi:hypothetical protein